jgi:uncharacterized protein (DUF2164 family)
MDKLTFTQDEKEQLVYKIKHYFQKELDEEIGQFDAEFLLDFFGKEIGSYYYNRGLQDAQIAVESQLETLKELLYSMEK